jgi:hypothetical protein
MKIHPSSDACLHSRPGIIDVNLIDLDLGLTLTVIEGPVWEQIRLDRDDTYGWWWHVRTEDNLLDGWLWEGHIKECLP